MMGLLMWTLLLLGILSLSSRCDAWFCTHETLDPAVNFQADRMTVGHKRLVSCKHGFSPSPQTRWPLSCRMVNDRPTWSQVRCKKIVCQLPLAPSGGKVTVQGVHGRADFSCRPGSQYTGPNPRYCQDNGLYDGTDGHCQQQRIGYQDTFSKGLVYVDDGHGRHFLCTDRGDFCYGQCAFEYSEKPISVPQCRQKKSVKCTPPLIENGVVPSAISVYHYGGVHIPKCKAGHTYIGTHLICAANGSFVGHGKCVADKIPKVWLIQFEDGAMLTAQTADNSEVVRENVQNITDNPCSKNMTMTLYEDEMPAEPTKKCEYVRVDQKQEKTICPVQSRVYEGIGVGLGFIIMFVLGVFAREVYIKCKITKKEVEPDNENGDYRRRSQPSQRIAGLSSEALEMNDYGDPGFNFDSASNEPLGPGQ